MRCGTLVRLSANGKKTSGLRHLNQKQFGIVLETCNMYGPKASGRLLVVWGNKKVWHYRRELAFARRSKCFQ